MCRGGIVRPVFLSSHIFGSQSSTLIPFGSMTHADLPFSRIRGRR
jgi:hypothetical protein